MPDACAGDRYREGGVRGFSVRIRCIFKAPLREPFRKNARSWRMG
jgi:hypothetical protein